MLSRHRARARARRERRLRGQIARVTRDKETFFVQRATLGRIETEAISKYV